ncbi:hypothetical protein PINS_up022286 [Pythium insidiosum]|nr:hypothetical protein PINS_up022286 [Pythium insidiosum]
MLRGARASRATLAAARRRRLRAVVDIWMENRLPRAAQSRLLHLLQQDLPQRGRRRSHDQIRGRLTPRESTTPATLVKAPIVSWCCRRWTTNAYVIARDAPHPLVPGKTLRTIVLRFRLQTERGSYVIGRACLNPTNPDLRLLDERESNVVYGDFNSWIEFVPLPSNGGCEVKFGAVCDFDTREDMQLAPPERADDDRHVESCVLGPPFKLHLTAE